MPADKVNWNQATQAGCLTFAGLVLLVPIVVYLLAPGTTRALRARSVPATVLTSAVVERPGLDEGTCYGARVLVRYQWEGVSYTSDYFRDELGTGKRQEAEREAAAFPAGQTLTVWVDPAVPGEGTGFRGFPSWTCLAVLGLLAALRFAVDDWAALVAAWRRRRGERTGVAALDPRPLEEVGFVVARGSLWATHVLPGTCLAASWLAWASAPLLAVVPVVVLAPTVALAWAHFLRQLAEDLRWRHATLVSRQQGPELRAVPAREVNRLDLVVERRLEVREVVSASRVGRWVQEAAGNEWVTESVLVALTPDQRALTSTSLRLTVQVPPPPASPPASGDGLERRVRTLLVVRSSRSVITFVWRG